MDMTGDVKLVSTLDGTELCLKNGTPEFDKTLKNAVYMSLFTQENEWYSDLLPVKIGSSIDSLSKEPLNNQTRNDAIEAAKKSLAWLKTTGYASEVNVTSLIPSMRELQLNVSITKPDGNTQNMEFLIPWNKLEEEL